MWFDWQKELEDDPQVVVVMVSLKITSKVQIDIFSTSSVGMF